MPTTMHQTATLLALAAALLRPAVATHAQSDADLGHRTALEMVGSQMDWRAGDPITVEAGEDQLAIRCRGASHGWAKPRATVGYVPGMKLLASLDAVRGAVRVQAEWSDGEGNFLEATKVLQRRGPTAEAVEIDLADHLPAAGDRVARVGFKVWVVGDDASAVFKRLRLVSPRAWSDDATQTLEALDPAAVQLEPGKGMSTRVEGGLRVLDLDGAEQASGASVRSRHDLTETLAVMVDAAYHTGGKMTIVAVCFDGSGAYVGEAPLFKALDSPGLYEKKFTHAMKPLPDGARRVGVKVWLIGDEVEAGLAGVYFGRAAD